MSNLGLLSHQYRELAELARQLKQWAVQVRRACHNLSASEVEDESDLTTALDELARVTRFLGDVVGLESEGAWPEHWLANPPVPTALVERLRDAHAYDRPLYIKQLGCLSEHLEQGVEALTERDLSLLDSIVLAAGADANAVFRRLMRWA